MAVAESPVYQEVYYFLASSPTPEEILAFRPAEATQQRIHTLLEASKAGRLSEADAAELDEFEQVEHFVRMLKLHARKLLNER
ncbi:MAG: hypothetical protein LC121_23120 [Anaerolineae bacterium]|nr:hypothetical protein [Anaerolineae bacterium]